MTDPIRTPYCHKVRYGISGAPTIDESEMDGSHASGIGLEPVLIELIYSAALKDRPASVTACVTGLWTRFGKREQPERTVTTHFTNGPDGWPTWLAAEARLHDPDAPADRAAVLTEAADALLALRDRLIPEPDVTGRYLAGLERGARELRRLAGGAAPNTGTETQSGGPRDDYEATTGHLITCLAVAGGWADPDCCGQKHDETVHACPPAGSGVTPCCGQTPFELPLTDRISSEAPSTCAGPTHVEGEA